MDGFRVVVVVVDVVVAAVVVVIVVVVVFLTLPTLAQPRQTQKWHSLPEQLSYQAQACDLF